MKAYVSSKSPVKHAAVEAAFARLGVEVETIATPTQSDVTSSHYRLMKPMRVR